MLEADLKLKESCEAVSPGAACSPSSSSSSSEDEAFDGNYLASFAALHNMALLEDVCSDDDLIDVEGLGFDYERLVEEEGIRHLPKSVPLDAKLETLGHAEAVVEKLLVAKPLRGDEIVDLDTLVILEDRRVVGKVYEVFGPIEAPLYSILLHPDFLEAIPPGSGLCYLPDQAALVQKTVLLAQKCTDADGEVGGEEEFSDDEAESRARKQKSRTQLKRRTADLEPGEIDE